MLVTKKKYLHNQKATPKSVAFFIITNSTSFQLNYNRFNLLKNRLHIQAQCHK